MQIGIPMDSDYRIKSGIKYALLVASYNGHTCVLKQNLKHKINQENFKEEKLWFF
mgnify:CR=1 FL=1